MGAGHCQWGGLTDRNICNIHGGEHLASCYRTMLRLWDFFQIWHLASHNGNLPILGDHSRGGLLSFSNFWQTAKNSWHAANSTPPDPPWSWIVPQIAPMTEIGPKKAYLHGYLTLTFDLWPQFVKKSQVRIEIYPHTENQAPTPIGCSRRACDGRLEGNLEGKLGNILWYMIEMRISV